MRINVYAEEMTDRIECISKTAGIRKFFGLRIYLASPPELLPIERGGRHGDDDQSAVTLWFTSHEARHDYTHKLNLVARRGVDR